MRQTDLQIQKQQDPEKKWAILTSALKRIFLKYYAGKTPQIQLTDLQQQSVSPAVIVTSLQQNDTITLRLNTDKTIDELANKFKKFDQEVNIYTSHL